MVVVIAAGGTGGHLFPGIAVAREFERLKPGSKIVFVGTANGLESGVVPKEGFELRLIKTGGFVGKGWRDKIAVLASAPLAFFQSVRLLKQAGPKIVIGVGGYASGPILAAATLMGIPTAVIEPNSIPGWTNRLLARWVDLVFVAFEETGPLMGRTDAQLAGNPVRRELGEAGSRPLSEGGRNELKTVLVMGGSQGARAINTATVDAAPCLLSAGVRLIHQTGPADLDRIRDAYAKRGHSVRAEAFIHDVVSAYREADLVVCRAGATTLAELTVCGRAAVLIPFPYATHDHQTRNAQAMVRAGAAELMLESEMTGARLAERVLAILADSSRLERMRRASRQLGRPRAAEEIVQGCVAFAAARG